MMRLTRLLIVFLTLSLAGPALVACGGMSSHETASAALEPITVQVNVLGNRFDVESLTVPAGSTVIWHNTTSANHGLVSQQFDVDLRPGQDYEFTYYERGTHHVRSRTHASAPGLQVWITVE